MHDAGFQDLKAAGFAAEEVHDAGIHQYFKAAGFMAKEVHDAAVLNLQEAGFAAKEVPDAGIQNLKAVGFALKEVFTSGESASDKRLVNASVERDESQHLCEQMTCVNKVTDKFAALPPFPIPVLELVELSAAVSDVSLSLAVNEYPGPQPEQNISFTEACQNICGESGLKAEGVGTRALEKLTEDVAKRALSLCKWAAKHDRYWALDVLERKRQLSIAAEPIRVDVAWLLDFGFLASVPAGFKKELRKALDQIFSIQIAASSHL